jgi:hypothetical protein
MDLDFEAWLLVGQENGWVSEVFCNTHDGGPLTDDEMQEWEEGSDPCMFCVRVNEYD